jgi:tetratricopeptide (TPR) repeat protein
MAALTLKEIASTVGCAESSVSRIIGEVEAETPWGRIPLKSLFSQKVPSRSGFTSQTAVIAKVAKIIQAEDKKNPLSDEDITNKMRLAGINIARRTITKYREKFKIASSSARKEDGNNSQSAYAEGDARKSIAYADAVHNINRAIWLYEQGYYEEAIEDCNSEIVKNPKDNLPYFYRGLCFLNLGKYDPGLMDMKKAARLGNLVAQERLVKIGER